MFICPECDSEIDYLTMLRGVTEEWAVILDDNGVSNL